MDCKIEDGLTDVFEVVGRHLWWNGGVFCLAVVLRLHICFAAKR